MGYLPLTTHFIKSQKNVIIMRKIKTIDEASRNYAIGAVQGAYKYKESWKKRGFNEEDSIKKTIPYAFKQVIAGTNSRNIKKRISEFRELSVISNTLADMLEQTQSN